VLPSVPIRASLVQFSQWQSGTTVSPPRRVTPGQEGG
jgi:hypothetical protein